MLYCVEVMVLVTVVEQVLRTAVSSFNGVPNCFGPTQMRSRQEVLLNRDSYAETLMWLLDIRDELDSKGGLQGYSP